VGLDQDGTGQAQQRGRVGKDSDYVGAALDFFVQAFQGLVDQIFFQWPTGKLAKAVMSSAASPWWACQALEGAAPDSGLRASLIRSLIQLRTPASIGVYHWPLSSQRDLRGRSCTVILNPEKRKVGGSTPPLTTSSDTRQWGCDQHGRESVLLAVWGSE
jgi:hypothetical protein